MCYISTDLITSFLIAELAIFVSAPRNYLIKSGVYVVRQSRRFCTASRLFGSITFRVYIEPYYLARFFEVLTYYFRNWVPLTTKLTSLLG